MLAKILLIYVYMILACTCLPVVNNKPPSEGQAGAGPDLHPQQGQTNIFAGDPLISRQNGVETIPKSVEGKQSQGLGLQSIPAVLDTKGQSQTKANQQGQSQRSLTSVPSSTQGKPKTSTASEQSQSKQIVSTSPERYLLQGQLDAQSTVSTQSNKAMTGGKGAETVSSRGQANTSESLIPESQGQSVAVKSQQNVNPGDTTGGNIPQIQLDMPAIGTVQPNPTNTQNKTAQATAATGASANPAKGQIRATAATQTSTMTGSSRGSTTTMEPLDVEAPEAEPPFDPTELEPPDHGQLPNQGASSSATSTGGHSIQQGVQVQANEVEPADLGTAQAPETSYARGTGSWGNPAAWLPGGEAYDPPEPTDAPPYFMF